MRKKFLYTAFLLMSFSLLSLQAQKADIRLDNQISIWSGFNAGKPVTWQAGARYIPVLSPGIQFKNDSRIDAELSLNSYGNLLFSKFNYDSADYDLKPYRMWIRYATSNLEIRAGLQKISFGSASVLRPLMWFDKMDFRDPLQLTDGVYALLGRYYFNNNINIWLWGLWGNDKTKGWEAVPSARKIPEFGGRFEYPAGKGEMAFSYHHRSADYSSLLKALPIVTDTLFSEQLFASDGKWDLGIGLWYEITGKLNDRNNPVSGKWELFYNLGLDYTFNIGNGLNIMSEYFHYSNFPENNQPEVKRNFSILSLSYPLFLTHNLSGMVYYNWDSKEWYRLISMQFKYNYLSIHLIAFWNPDDFNLYGAPGERNLFSGKGFQAMLVLDI
ncbi:MAG TPA: hypothetical protein P5180_11890 [Bacteroidales bacterium]|nr:hypothetical protein [Bacteroidales bacterium]HRW86126.1 hypothetical protein [Bacteroidales bacterium]